MCVIEWDFVAVNAGYGDSGFFFNASGLQWEESSGTFGGWLGGFLLPLLFSFLPLSFLPSFTTSTAALPHSPLPIHLFPHNPFHLASSSSSSSSFSRG